MTAPGIPPAYRRLIESSRVSTGTRDALLARARPDSAAYRPVSLSQEDFATLQAVTDCVVPQPDDAFIDVAARIDAQLGEGKGDGWRYDDLPPDAQAYGAGLRTLNHVARAEHGRDFAALDADARGEILQRAASGRLEAAANGSFDGRQMSLWFEDLRGDAVRLYVAHPATLARIGFGGLAYGGDGAGKPGFAHVGIGAREAWEPLAEPAVSR